jgi:hypothetical protein
MLKQEPVVDFLAPLAEAANAADSQAFIAACECMDWSLARADDYLRAVQLALAAGAQISAREIAIEGATHFPEHAELAKAARILAPPRVIQSEYSSDREAMQLNRQWLDAHGAEFKGQWVAVSAGRFVASATTAAELRQRVELSRAVLITHAS